MNIISARCVR